jgi:hypothetical protein
MPDDSQSDYQQLLMAEQAAWKRLWESRQSGEELDPAVFADWLRASRLAAAARNANIDRLLAEDPGVMQRPMRSDQDAQT